MPPRRSNEVIQKCTVWVSDSTVFPINKKKKMTMQLIYVTKKKKIHCGGEMRRESFRVTIVCGAVYPVAPELVGG